MVMESGRHQLSSGLEIEAGIGTATTSRSTRTFTRNFSGVPVVFAMPQTENESDGVVIHVDGVTSSSFRSRMVEQEKGGKIGAGGSHAPETLGYIAVQQGFATTDGLTLEAKRTATAVEDDWFLVTYRKKFKTLPLLFVHANTENEQDTFDTHIRLPNKREFQVRIDEEKSRDPEVAHAKEAVGFLALIPAGSIEVKKRSNRETLLLVDDTNPSTHTILPEALLHGSGSQSSHAHASESEPDVGGVNERGFLSRVYWLQCFGQGSLHDVDWKPRC